METVVEDDVTVPAEYARCIGDQLRSMGVSVDDWIVRSGVTSADLAAPEGMLSYRAFRRLVHNALAAVPEPALGLFVGERLVASTHGIVGAAAVNSSTVRMALDVVERFSRLRSSLIVITDEVKEGEIRVRFDAVLPLGELQRPLLEAVVLSIKNVLDEVTMGAVDIEETAFAFAEPDYASLAREIFNCPVSYGQDWTGFRGSKDMLDVPLKLADPEAFQEAARICQRELARIAEQETLSARLRRLLLERQNGFPSLQVTARLFHMTPRTLHRRLKEEGTSYREQLESVRHTLAVEHLKANRFTIEEVAYRLGYTDLANFRRAFKRWEGVAPTEFQKVR